jgi:hypothetical protein
VLLVLGLCLFFRWHDPQPYSGDEPHYLLVSESLVRDGDVDVKNDYLEQRYRVFYAGHLDPHVNESIFTARAAHWYSMHGVGLSAALVPAYAADGAHGATIAMCVIAAATLLLTFLWARRLTGEVICAAAATAALGFSPGFLGLEGRVFPDLASATLLLACLLLLELPARRPRHLLLLGVLVGVSPWFHFKNGLAFGTIAAIALVQIVRSSTGRARIEQIVALAAPTAVSLIGYELSVVDWYGSWSPTRMVQPGNRLFAISAPRGFLAASFDAARGLFTNNPALLLIFAGLPIWWRLFRGPFLRLALILGPAILLQATFSDWSGAYAPESRYALEFVPAAIPAVALLLREAPKLLRLVACAFLGLQWILALAFVWLRPPWSPGGVNRSSFFGAIDGNHGPPLDHLMPRFDTYSAHIHGALWLAAWVVAGVLLVAAGAQVQAER